MLENVLSSYLCLVASTPINHEGIEVRNINRAVIVHICRIKCAPHGGKIDRSTPIRHERVEIKNVDSPIFLDIYEFCLRGFYGVFCGQSGCLGWASSRTSASSTTTVRRDTGRRCNSGSRLS